ncbi:hypothetical protein IJ182_09630 [bacterium]|nr:hypothetical protein [bacterium]
MKKFKFIMLVICICIIPIINIQAKADFMTVVDHIQRTSDAINSVNQAGRGILSVTEYFQRFKDRGQDRRERKQAEKAYNEAAKQEYENTLKEIEILEQRYYGTNL